MPSFFDLQRYAVTGIAAPDMTAYDKARALAAFGGGAVQTLTGIPPLSFKADGTPLISCSMLGNGQQTGTPTPDNPVMPEFVGARTANLFNPFAITAGRISGTTGNIEYSSATTIHDASINSITFSTTAAWRGFTTDFIQTSTKLRAAIGSFVGGDGATCTAYQYAYAQDKSFLGFIAAGSNAPEGTQYIRVSFQCNVIVTNAVATNIMLNLGSTALPFEPFGYKIPLTCAGQTTPVYLGQTQTVRRVKKLVLTGEERDWVNAAVITATNAYQNVTATAGYKRETFYCSHMVATTDSESAATHGYIGQRLTLCMDKTLGLDTVDKFQAYLAAQYAAGHPVTIWYVLAEPETAIVNEPLAKIGDYADELHSTDAGVSIPTAKGQNTLTVDTELQPHEMTITFKG